MYIFIIIIHIFSTLLSNYYRIHSINIKGQCINTPYKWSQQHPFTNHIYHLTKQQFIFYKLNRPMRIDGVFLRQYYSSGDTYLLYPLEIIPINPLPFAFYLCSHFKPVWFKYLYLGIVFLAESGVFINFFSFYSREMVVFGCWGSSHVHLICKAC